MTDINEFVTYKLDEDTSYLNINDIEYVMDKDAGAVCHTMMLLVEQLEKVNENLQKIYLND